MNWNPNNEFFSILLELNYIDSRLMVVHIREGKGHRDRDLPMTPKLLEALRDYWRAYRPTLCMFPSPWSPSDKEKPLTPKSIYHACKKAAARAGITKTIGPHTLRHCFATHHLDSGTELRTIQYLLGHSSLKHTVAYLHLSQRHMRAAANPLDQLNRNNGMKPESENDPL